MLICECGRQMGQEANSCDACILERRAEIENSPLKREQRAEEKRKNQQQNFWLIVIVIVIVLVAYFG